MQARFAFATYLSRVQQRLMTENGGTEAEDYETANEQMVRGTGSCCHWYTEAWRNDWHFADDIWNAFSWMKTFEFQITFYWNMFLNMGLIDARLGYLSCISNRDHSLALSHQHQWPSCFDLLNHSRHANTNKTSKSPQTGQYLLILCLQDLVLRFLKRAAGNLQQPFKVIVPSRKLQLSDRRRILAKQLADFVQIYNKVNCQLGKCAIS